MGSSGGVDRGSIYVTNAVKHFRFVLKGKRRLHQTPGRPAIEACRPWLERELDLVQPKLVLAMGGTAAEALFGRAMPIGRSRGSRDVGVVTNEIVGRPEPPWAPAGRLA